MNLAYIWPEIWFGPKRPGLGQEVAKQREEQECDDYCGI